MSTNTLGRVLTLTTFGESHGPAIGCVIDGFPPGMAISPEEIKAALLRRATGQSRWTSQRKEQDDVKIVSGVFEGVTTGAPIAMVIENTDARSKDYSKIKDQFRPGHADYTYHHKYGIRDYRGGGRSSARETTMRVAAGALASKYLKHHHNIEIIGWMSQIGSEVCDEQFDEATIKTNPFFCPDPDRIEALEAYMKSVWKSGDSVGAKVKVQARGVPVGWGAPVYAKLDTDLCNAMMSINATKGVEVGAGFAAVSQTGTEHRDEMTPDGFLSNQAGGIVGGISTGQPIEVAVAFKPTSSLRLPGQTVDVTGQPVEVITTGRHDPCVGIRAVPIVESMMAWVLMDHLLLHRAQCHDVPAQTPRIPT